MSLRLYPNKGALAQIIINQLDLGAPSHPWAKPIVGQNVGIEIVEGYEPTIWPRGSIERKQTVSFSVKAWQALGGQAANTTGAMKYLLKQVEELASSRDQQPAYIQWTSTADPAGSYNAIELHDGWYVIDQFEPDYSRNVVTGLVLCRMTVTEVAPAPPRSVAFSYAGGALSSNFSGAAQNLVALPLSSINTSFGGATASLARTAAEGSISCILVPAASPLPFVLSSTISNWWKGGVHVYDTINTGSNPVPTAGLFVNANWVEVFSTDHDFVGDCVVTNGLLLLLFQATVGNVCTGYVWNIVLSPAAWQQFATFDYADNAGNAGVLRSYALIRTGAEEASLRARVSNGTSGHAADLVIRLGRGNYYARVDEIPQTQTAASNTSLLLTYAHIAKIAYDSASIADTALSDPSPTVVTDYGYGVGFTTLGAESFLAGFLYQNQPATAMPYSVGNNVSIGQGDSASVVIGARRSYGIFATPYGVNGSFDASVLKAEAEGGTLGTGWSSVADGAASAGNAAKAASGTASGNADTFGTQFIPIGGSYDIWFRVKVTSAAGSAAEMQLGLWDASNSSFVASTTFRANQASTSYVWLRGCTGVAPTAGHNMQFRAVTAATLGTDWFIDEGVMAPKQLSGDNRGPQDLFQQFIYDRSVRMIRP